MRFIIVNAYYRQLKILCVLQSSLTLLSSYFALMLKLKFLFAFFLMHSAMFAWGQQTQPTTSTASSAAKSSAPPSTASESSAKPSTAPQSKPIKTTSKTEIDAALAGINNAKGLVCTIFAGAFDWLTLSYVVSTYSTYMVEPSCDEKYYYNLTVASIVAQTLATNQSVKVFRGGSHQFIMDVNLSTVRNPFFYIGNLRFSKNGEVRISIFDAIKRKTEIISGLIDSPYSIYEYSSQIFYIWNIGTLAHRLVSPVGDTFIMYSFTNEVSTTLTREGLLDLKDELNLPPGWKYENFLVSETITVRTMPTQGYISSVVFDELNNFYVKYQQ